MIIVIVEDLDLLMVFGYGMLVVGFVYVVVLEVCIFLLCVFDGSGEGDVFDIVWVIYYVVD